MNRFDHFDFLAPFYDRIVRIPLSPRVEELLKLPKDGLLLDAGGGTGRASSHLRPAVGRLILCDFSLPMLKQAAAGKGLHAVVARAESLPFADDMFDRVMVVDALHHFFDQGKAIGDLLRVLKPGGRMLIEEPDRSRWSIRLLAVAEKMVLMRSRIHTMEEIRDMIAARGAVASIERGNSFTSWVVADKRCPP